MTFVTVKGSGYGSIYVDSLVWGGRLWDPETPIKVWIGDSGEFATALAGRGNDAGFFAYTGTDAIEDWVVGEGAYQSLIYATQLYQSVCNIKFEGADSITEADIVWWKVDLSALGSGIAGIHETLAKSPASRTQLWGYFNPRAEASWSNQFFGGDGLNTIIHEIGHGLGLAHPHDGGSQRDATVFPGAGRGGVGKLWLNQGAFTVMSYNPGLKGTEPTLEYGNQGALGAFDIAALQALYGANMEAATGDDVYELPNQNAAGTGWGCIWDAGGNDTISAVNATGSVTIDLRAATLINGDPNAGGYLSMQSDIAGGFTIAKGVEIENAIGGMNDDVLLGNEKGNDLQGNDGADVLAGFGGADFLFGGEGDDNLEGGADADVLDGGEGFDFATYTVATAGVIVNLANPDENAGDAKGDTFISIEGVIGSNYADTITGSDTDDLLMGGGGRDVLTGGAGTDIFMFGSKVSSKSRDQIMDFVSGEDQIYLDNLFMPRLRIEGQLSESAFRIGSRARDSSDRIIYNEKTGYLYYDPDGKGSKAAILFATLDPGTKLFATDFIVV